MALRLLYDSIFNDKNQVINFNELLPFKESKTRSKICNKQIKDKEISTNLVMKVFNVLIVGCMQVILFVKNVSKKVIIKIIDTLLFDFQVHVIVEMKLLLNNMVFVKSMLIFHKNNKNNSFRSNLNEECCLVYILSKCLFGS